jgi:hypothetical protein
MVEKIKDKLSEYAEFDIGKLVDTSGGRYIRIFGGAIRDIIAGKEIHDIDVVIGSKSMEHCVDVLINNGYKLNHKLCTKDWNSLYSDISIINEPHTWIKGDKIIQLIRPSGSSLGSYRKSFLNVLQSVDILCCGVSYDGKSLYENKEGAINDCLSHKLTVCDSSSMYNTKRTDKRLHKLGSRGWGRFGKDRLRKLNDILELKSNISFIKEYNVNKNIKNHITNNYIDDDIW